MNPTHSLFTHWCHNDFGIVFIFHTVFEDFKLKLTNGTKHVFACLVVGVELDGSFLHQLFDSFVEGLLFHDVFSRNFHEQLRRKGW